MCSLQGRREFEQHRCKPANDNVHAGALAARMATSERCSRRTPEAKRTAVPKGRGCRGRNATIKQFPASATRQ
jgi:hypothetical protein